MQNRLGYIFYPGPINATDCSSKEWLTQSKGAAIFPHLLSWSLIFPLLFAMKLAKLSKKSRDHAIFGFDALAVDIHGT